MTFGGHIVYLGPEYSCNITRAKMMPEGTQINYMPDKSHVIIIIVS